MAILEELKAKANGKADQANNIQEAISMMEFGGGAGGIMIINNTDSTLDKTWQEIYDAMSAGVLCYISSSNGTTEHCAMDCVAIAEHDGPDYIVSSITISSGEVSVKLFITSSANDHPVLHEGK